MFIINHLYRKIINKSIKDTLIKEIDLVNVGNYVDFVNTLDEFMSKWMLKKPMVFDNICNM